MLYTKEVMKMKGFTLGVLATIMILATIGGAYAAFQTGGTITVPTGKTAIYFMMDTPDAIELRDALCHNGGYEEQIIDPVTFELIDNPQSCASFADQMIKSYGLDQIAGYRRWQDEQEYVPTALPAMTN